MSFGAYYPAPARGESFARYAVRTIGANAPNDMDLEDVARHYALAAHGMAAVPRLAQVARADKAFGRFMLLLVESLQSGHAESD